MAGRCTPAVTRRAVATIAIVTLLGATTRPTTQPTMVRVAIQAYGLGTSSKVSVSETGLLTYEWTEVVKQGRGTMQLSADQMVALSKVAKACPDKPNPPSEEWTDYRIIHTIGDHDFSDGWPNPRFYDLNAKLGELEDLVKVDVNGTRSQTRYRPAGG